MRRLNLQMTALAVVGLSAAAGAASASQGTVSGTVNVRGTEVVDGVSFGAFATISTDPLVTDPDVPEPVYSQFPIEEPIATPTGDYISFGGYAFSLSQSNAEVFQTALINPYASYKTLVVDDLTGDPTTAPLILKFTLPSPYTSTVPYSEDPFVDGDITNEPVLYDTSNFLTESMTLTRVSTDAFKYNDAIVFDDPANQGQLDELLVTGEVTVNPEDGGLFVSDSDSLVLKGPTNSAGTLIGDDSFLITGKASSTGFISGPIPEPGTWTLMILGLGASGATLRRRQCRGGLARA
jgi:hypothetical protein